jgi:very-short-patch-repair endonuclease
MSRIHYKNFKRITLLARDLRKNQTHSEKILWELLRKKQLSGYKFLRQHPIFYRLDNNWVEFYIADFYCSELRLIIEMDGPIHDFNKEYDIDRDSRLLSKDINTVRIKNEELEDLNKVMSKINSIISGLILKKTCCF